MKQKKSTKKATPFSFHSCVQAMHNITLMQEEIENKCSAENFLKENLRPAKSRIKN
jgi:hypothetical protein